MTVVVRWCSGHVKRHGQRQRQVLGHVTTSRGLTAVIAVHQCGAVYIGQTRFLLAARRTRLPLALRSLLYRALPWLASTPTGHPSPSWRKLPATTLSMTDFCSTRVTLGRPGQHWTAIVNTASSNRSKTCEWSGHRYPTSYLLVLVGWWTGSWSAWDVHIVAA